MEREKYPFSFNAQHERGDNRKKERNENIHVDRHHPYRDRNRRARVSGHHLHDQREGRRYRSHPDDCREDENASAAAARGWYCARGRHCIAGHGKQERLMADKTVMCIGGNKMKKLFLATLLLALVIVVPIPTMAGVNIGIGISLPLPIVFEAPPDVIVLPDTNDVYVVPDIDVDLFFWNGWWWRPWEGRWYRSHYYNRGWGYYNNVPSFYFDVDPGWRGYYRDHNWYGHRWNYERIPDQRRRQNWKSWHNDRHWERQGTWGVQSYQPRPQQQRQELRQQRQHQYQQRPEVQQHQQQRQQQQRQPQVQPAEKGRTITPQGGPTGRGERRQVKPEEKVKPVGPEGKPEPRGKKKMVKPGEKMKPAGPEGGPAPRGYRPQVKPEKKPVVPEGGPAPKDRKKPEGPQKDQKDQKKQRTEEPER
jgi:hypothetical protein